MALCTVTGVVYLPTGEVARSRVFVFSRADKKIGVYGSGAVVPDDVWVKTNGAGELSVELLDGAYIMASGLDAAAVVVPDAETASLVEIMGETVVPLPDAAPLFTSLPTLSGSTALGGVITVNLGAASGSPTPVITGSLTRPGASPVSVTQGQLITVQAGDQGGSMSLTATATNRAGVDTETVSRAIPAAVAAPVFTTPLPDVVLAVGDADVVTNLDDNTDNATSYSVSPAGGAVSISGSAMTVSADAPVDQNYTVTATGPGGTATDTFGVLVESVDVTVVGGTAIGQTGASSTIYEGFRLAEGDDFETQPTRWSGRSLDGRYTHSILHAQHIRRTSTPTDRMIYMDPTYRGPRHESTVDLGYDGVTIANSVATMTASPSPSELVPFLPATYDGGRGDANDRPLLISGSLKTSPSFMLSAEANFVIEAKVRLQGGNVAGYWPSFWTTTFFWPDFAEIDVLEAKKAVGGGTMTTLMNFIHSDVDGGGPGGVVWRTEAEPTIPPNRWVQLVAKRINDTLEFWDDIAAEGVLARRVVVTDATRLQRMRGAHDVRLDLAVSTVWDGSTFNIAHWPATVEFDWWRAWVPANAAHANEPLTVLPPVYTTPGGSWAATFPSRTEMFGADAGREQVIQAWDGPDGPGRPTRSNVTNLSTTLTVDLTNRTAAGTVPTTEGGATGLFFTYAYADGSPARRVLMPYYVAPAVQSLPTSWPVEPGADIDITIPYTAFHSGNLGPHTYTVTAPGLTVTGNGTTEASITGTAGAQGANVEVTISATNIEGQTTTTTRTIVVATEETVFHPSQLASVLAVVDPMEMVAFTDVAGTTPATVGSNIARIDTKGVSFTQATASKRPQLLSDGTRQYVQSDGTDLLSAATRLGLSANPALEISAGLRVLSSQLGAYSSAQIGDAGAGILAVGGGADGWSWRHNNGAAIFQVPPVNADRVVSWRRPAGGNYDSQTFISSGTPQARVSVINPTNVPTSTAEAAHLFGGVNSSGDASLNARYYGLVISSGASDAELAQITEWLRQRSGIV